jgi:Arc/MetJ-type ribon-helix-helix transcriptional regulator
MRIRLAHISSLLSITFATLILFTNVHAQPPTPQMPSPPPMRFVLPEDRNQLAAIKDPKARVRVTIELTEARLTKIEQLTAEKSFPEASEVLGNYLGLVEDAMQFVGHMTPDKNSTRDLYRRLDIALRAQIPRLAVMRRDTPADYSIHLKAAEEFVRNARSDALDSFYGHTVLRESPNSDAKNASPENKRP